MANTRVSDLAAGGAFANSDLFYVVETPGTGGVQKTGTQLVEFIQDTVNSLLVGGTNISLTYNDPANTLTIAFTGTIPASTADLPDAAGFRYFYGLSGDVTATAGAGPGAAAATIANDAVTNAKLANMAQKTVKGRSDGAGTGDPEDITGAQLRAIQDIETTDAVRFGKLGLNGDPSSGEVPLRVFGINTTDPQVADIQVIKEGYFSLNFFDTYATSGSTSFVCRRARGTFASPTAVVDADTAGVFSFRAYDGTAFWQTAAIVASLDGAVSTNVVPMRLTFNTGTATVTSERMRITSAGNVGIGTTAPTTPLHVNGAARVGSFTVAGVPSASTSGAGSIIYVSNETGGAVLAFSDGTNWRRVADRAIIS